MNLLTSYKESGDFWRQNPQLTLHPDLQEFYKSDKSKGKQLSSRLMYAVVFVCDTSEENKFSNYPIKDRKFLVSQEIIGNAKFNWEEEKIVILIKAIEGLLLTPLRRSANNWRKKLEERDAFLASTPYTMENAQELDKILSSTDKLYSQYERIMKSLAKEEQETQSRGNQQLSLSDKDEI